MNTTQKGNDFEKRFYGLLYKTVNSGDFKLKIDDKGYITILPEDSLIYIHKKYKCRWNSTSDVDVSLECKAIPLTVIIECKNYSKAVDVGELNELKGRLDGLDEQEVKGILVTSGKFQRGVIDAAKYHNIALIRVKDNDTLEWDAYRLGYEEKLTYKDAISTLMNDEERTVVLDGSNVYFSVCDYVSQILNITPNQIKKEIRFLSNKEINKRTLEFLGDYDYDGEISNSYIREMAGLYDIGINLNSDIGGCLGRYDFLNRNVYVADSLNKDVHRQRFTLGHEIGHAILHHDALHNLFKSAVDNDLLEKNTRWNKWLEIQANTFASYMLIPDNTLIRKLIGIKLDLGIPLDMPFYLDKQRCNISACNAAIHKLSQILNVSHEVVKYRLINSNHLRIG